MANVLDPITQIQVPLAGNLLFMMMGLMLVQSGGLHSFVSALFFSYDVIPIGHAEILNNGAILNGLLTLMSNYFLIGVQISMPIVGSLMILTIALGLLVKSVPQMNIFVVGMPVKLLLGLMILYFIIPVFADVYNVIFSQATRAVINMLNSLRGSSP
jgi:flagellar biosynthetic protein FliR